MDETGVMADRVWTSPADKRAARDAARKGARIRHRAIKQAMLAGWAGEDADELNWLDEAYRAHPGPEATARDLYGMMSHLIERLAEVTGQDRKQVLEDLLG